MLCPSCGSEATKVLDSRIDSLGRLRKRRCTDCGHPFATVERIAADDLTVRKRDGSLEDFSRAKLVRSITKAAHLYALPPADVDAFVDRVLRRLQPTAPGMPIPSTEIGQLVLQELQDSRDVTDIARIRYALVFIGQQSRYSGLPGLQEFMHWLEEAYGRPNAEILPETPQRVIKRDGRAEPFQLRKLQRSVEIATKGRGTGIEVREMAARVASSVGGELDGQALVTSQQIAAEVVKQLLKRDPIAYLRYASVVKRYRSTDDCWTDVLALTHERDRDEADQVGQKTMPPRMESSP